MVNVLIRRISYSSSKKKKKGKKQSLFSIFDKLERVSGSFRITKFENEVWRGIATMVNSMDDARTVDYSRIFQMTEAEKGRRRHRGRKRKKKSAHARTAPGFACIFEREKRKKGKGGKREKKAVGRGKEISRIGTVKRVPETSSRIEIGIEIGSRQRTIGWDVNAVSMTTLTLAAWCGCFEKPGKFIRSIVGWVREETRRISAFFLLFVASTPFRNDRTHWKIITSIDLDIRAIIITSWMFLQIRCSTNVTEKIETKPRFVLLRKYYKNHSTLNIFFFTTTLVNYVHP